MASFIDLLMRARLAKLKMNLAEDFVIVNDGEAPTFILMSHSVGRRTAHLVFHAVPYDEKRSLALAQKAGILPRKI
jgi:hypothetical protein